MFVFSRCGDLIGRLVVERLGRYGHGVAVLGGAAEDVAALGPGSATTVALDDGREVARHMAYGRALLILPGGPGEPAIDEAALLDDARRSGIRRVVRLSMHGAHPDAPAPLLRRHGEADAALAASGIPYVILRPHLLMQDLLLFAPGIRAGVPLPGPASGPAVGYADVRDVADAVAAALQRPGLERATLTLTGPRAWRLDEVAQALGDAVGAPVPFETVVDHGFSANLERMGISIQRSASVGALLRAYRHDEPVFPTISRLTGLPPRALEMFMLDQRIHFAARPATPAAGMGEADVVQLDHALTW